MVQTDGNIVRLTDKNEQTWNISEIAKCVGTATNFAGEVRLRVADLDNNGAVDLILVPVGFAAGLPAAIDRCVVLAEPGRTYAPPPAGIVWGRIAYVTALGDSAEQCGLAIDAADAALRIEPVR